jgi:very-short-patch-repair endonuclease
MTPAEHALWQAIRGRRLGGLKFRRQHPLGPFVVDFVCPPRKLVIELDGEVHDDRVGYDEARTEQLSEYGYRVLRFRNQEVLMNLGAVLTRIALAAQAPTPTPSPILGEGLSCQNSPPPSLGEG